MIRFMARLACIPFDDYDVGCNFIVHGKWPFRKKELAILYLAAFYDLPVGTRRTSLDQQLSIPNRLF